MIDSAESRYARVDIPRAHKSLRQYRQSAMPARPAGPRDQEGADKRLLATGTGPEEQANPGPHRDRPGDGAHCEDYPQERGEPEARGRTTGAEDGAAAEESHAER